ncbi:MAG: acyl--CoA ligase [Desulfuromusa sp.]|nr:acyl--CoA ligase [Desulfuromusa sp.]
MTSLLKPQRLLGEGMLFSAQRHPDKTAIVVEGKPFTYQQLKDTSLRLAAAFKAKGLSRGDRVAIYMDNTWPCIVSVYATLLAGGVFFIINPQTKADKLLYYLQDSEAKILLTDTHLEKKYLVAGEKTTHLETIIASGQQSASSTVQNVFITDFYNIIEQTEPLTTAVKIIPTDLAAFIYTSGSTGEPKAIMHTHQAMVFAAWSLIEYLRLGENDRILVVIPFAFDYGLYQLLMTMKLGATLIVERSFTFPAKIYQRIEEQKVTVFPGVPTVFAMMIETHNKKKLEFPAITRITNTAAALPAASIPRLQEIFPNALVYKMYGLSECKRVCYLEPELLDEKPQSVGQAIPGTETFLLDPDGEPVAPGEVGILHVRGPHVMVGYWKLPELSSHMLKPGRYPGERVLCTHDWFKMDADGDLYFVGRSDDIIKTRGEKVSPTEVENVLHKTVPGVREAVVVGVNDQVLGQAIIAYLVIEAGIVPDERQIKKICLANLENFMVPQSILFLDEMPKTPNGKIDRKLLQQQAEGLNG